MTPFPRHRFQDDPRPPPQDAQTGAPLVALWHAVWAVAVSLTALSAQMAGSLHNGPLAALLTMALPGVLGVALMVRDTLALRLTIMVAWMVAATAAAGLTGGVTGALPGLVVLPLAAGVALDHERNGRDGLTWLGVGGLLPPLFSGLTSLSLIHI